MTECGRIRPELKAYADGELSGRLRERVGAHVDACASCRGELAAIQRLGQELRILETAHPRPELRRRILAEVERIRASSPRRARWLAWLDANRLAVATAAAAAVAAVFLVPRVGQMPVPATPPPPEGPAVHEAVPRDASSSRSALAGQPLSAPELRTAKRQEALARPVPATVPAPSGRSRAQAPPAPPTADLHAESLPAQTPALGRSPVPSLAAPRTAAPGADTRLEGDVAAPGVAAKAVPTAPAPAGNTAGTPDEGRPDHPARDTDPLHYDSPAAPGSLQEKLVMTVDRLDLGVGEVRAAAREAGGYAREAVRESIAGAVALANQTSVTVVVPQDRVDDVKARLMRFQLRQGEPEAPHGAALEEQRALLLRAGGDASQPSAAAGSMGGIGGGGAPGGGFGGAGTQAGQERARRTEGQAAGKPAESGEIARVRSARPDAKAGQRTERTRSRQLEPNHQAAPGAGQAQRSQKARDGAVPPGTQKRTLGAHARTLQNAAVPLVKLQVEIREARSAFAAPERAAPGGKAGQNKGD